MGRLETCHPVHEPNESPERYSVVLLDRVDRGQKIAHALDIPKVTVIFIVRKEHIFHLLKVNIGANLCEGRVRIWMGYVFALEERNLTIGAVDIFLYM